MQKATVDSAKDLIPASLDKRRLLTALRSFRKGDFSIRLPVGLSGIDGDICDAFNDVVELNERTTKEFARLGDIVGKDGKIGYRAKLHNATGSWADSIEIVNTLIA